MRTLTATETEIGITLIMRLSDSDSDSDSHGDNSDSDSDSDRVAERYSDSHRYRKTHSNNDTLISSVHDHESTYALSSGSLQTTKPKCAPLSVLSALSKTTRSTIASQHAHQTQLSPNRRCYFGTHQQQMGRASAQMPVLLARLPITEARIGSVLGVGLKEQSGPMQTM